MNFFSDISLWWSIPWLGLAILITVWYYTGQKVFQQSKRWKKAALLALRSSGLFLLGLLLFGVLFEAKDVKTQKPVLINLVDNSSSMLNYKDSTSVPARVQSYLKEFQENFSDKYDIQNYVIDNGLEIKDVDFKGSVSDHYSAFDQIFNRYYNQNKGAIVFISDGNYNQGNSPIYSAEKISLTPIYTLGVGDTLTKVDHMIRNISVNEICFYKNDFPVDVEIEANRIPEGEYLIELWSGGKKIQSQKLNYTNARQQFYTVKFLVNAASIGFVPYEVRIQEVNGESSLQNNRRKFYVEVIDSRSKVVLLADGPHPDIKAIHQMLELDENLEIESHLTSEWEGNLSDASLLILRINGRNDLSGIVREARSKKIPTFYMFGAQLSNRDIASFQLNLNYPSGNSLDEVQVYQEDGFSLFQISEGLRTDLSKWPPLKVRFGKASVAGSSVFLKQKIGPVLKADHVLSFTNKNGRKEAFLMGEGLWRWRLDDYRRNRNNDKFRELISGLTQYLLVKQNKYPLRVKLPKRFTTLNDVIINAEFYNEALEQITDPEIDLVLTDQNGREMNFTFSSIGAGYLLDMGKLNAGNYRWLATAEWNGKKYQKSGEFIVEDVSLEKLATKADHDILKTISMNSGGSFFKMDNYSALISDLKKREDINVISYEESSFSELIEYIWFCFLIALLFSLEWFIRKYEGGY